MTQLLPLFFDFQKQRLGNDGNSARRLSTCSASV